MVVSEFLVQLLAERAQLARIRARQRAIDEPIPPLAPVTRAVIPSSENI